MLLHLWDFPGKSTGVGCHFLLQRLFPTQGSNPGLLHCRQTLYHLIYKGSPSSPITSWQIDGQTVADFILGASKITADDDCSHEIKRRLLIGRKVMTNLDSILKSRDITLSANVHLVKAMVFPIVMYGCESWTIKKAEK